MEAVELSPIGPADIELFSRVIDDLVSGGVDVLMANEQKLARSPVGAFMRMPAKRPATLDPARIYSRWNRTPLAKPRRNATLNNKAIWDRWNKR